MEANSPGNFTQPASISPSAYSLLLMKGLTTIPYARQAAQLLIAPKPYEPTAVDRPPLFWARLMHFENRYWSIDQLMEQLPITNILELSSGFSFRGLALSRQQPVFYLDTDLPELIATKQQFVTALTREDNGNAAAPPGHYELQPLNVLDESAFEALIDRFPTGELLILNEGLLVYLDLAEKETLCRTIKKILQRRGGYWITADIYIQKDLDPTLIDRQDAFSQFLQQHNIEEKKFPDFETAAEFFTRMGFIVDREAKTDVTKLSTWPRLLATITPDIQKKLFHTPKLQATWRLRIAAQ
ncbi:MAG TPA: hypothetical protein VNW04_13000 [Puia sp.]|nr:hypothetical protein [Puia sp.]